jgi:hypothetical protein
MEREFGAGANSLLLLTLSKTKRGKKRGRRFESHIYL